MDPIQIILVVFGVGVAAGGIVMVARSAGRGEDARRGYLPFGMIVVGLLVAYRAYNDFGTMDSQDIAIMFLFAVALLTLIGLQFFIVERNRNHLDAPPEPRSGQAEREDT